MAWGREESIGQSGRADLGLEEDGDASHGKAPHAAAGRSSRMPQSRNQSSPVPPPPSAGPGGRDIAAAEETFWGLIAKFVDLLGASRRGPEIRKAGRAVGDRWALARFGLECGWWTANCLFFSCGRWRRR